MNDDETQEQIEATIGDIFASMADDRKWAQENYGADGSAVISAGIKVMDYLTGMFLDDKIERGALEYVKRQFGKNAV